MTETLTCYSEISPLSTLIGSHDSSEASDEPLNMANMTWLLLQEN